MQKIKILNLYACIGGNRKMWGGGDHSITAVEYDQTVADVYAHNFPDDEIIMGDAHEYLLQNYDKFDFIWASPPCPTHSRARYWRHKTTSRAYPDMRLWQEIIYLKHHYKGKWIIENTIPYYDPLVQPSVKLGRHMIWSNYKIPKIKCQDADITGMTTKEFKNVIGIDIDGFKFTQRKDKIMRNCVAPATGKYILNCALNIIASENLKQSELF